VLHFVLQLLHSRHHLLRASDETTTCVREVVCCSVCCSVLHVVLQRVLQCMLRVLQCVLRCVLHYAQEVLTVFQDANKWSVALCRSVCCSVRYSVCCSVWQLLHSCRCLLRACEDTTCVLKVVHCRVCCNVRWSV